MENMIHISKAVISEGGKYLLLKRASGSPNYPGAWDFTGGKDDPGETPEESVVRETKEETSLDIKPGKEIKSAAYKDREHDLFFHYFIPESVSGSVKLSSDHSEYKWLPKEDIEKLTLHPSVTLFFQN